LAPQILSVAELLATTMAAPLPEEKPLLDLHGLGGEAVVKILAHEEYKDPRSSLRVLLLLYRQPLERRSFANKARLIQARTEALKAMQQKGAGDEAVEAYIDAQKAVQRACAGATSEEASKEGIYAFPRKHTEVHLLWQQAQKRAREAEKAAKAARRKAETKAVLPAPKRRKRGKEVLRCAAPLDATTTACVAWCAANCVDDDYMYVPADDVLHERWCECDDGNCQCPWSKLATWSELGHCSSVSRKMRSHRTHCESLSSPSGGLKPMIDRNFISHDLAGLLAKNARKRQAEFLTRAIAEAAGVAGDLALVGIYTSTDRFCELWAIDESLERAIQAGLSGENISLPHLASLLNDPEQFWDRFVNTWRKLESDVYFALQTIFRVPSESIDKAAIAELHSEWKVSYDEAKAAEKSTAAAKLKDAARNAAARRSMLETQHDKAQSETLSAVLQ
jgi:hypothetical protein